MNVKDLPTQDELPERNILEALRQDRDKGKISKQEFIGGLLDWSYEFVYKKDGYKPRQMPSKPFTLTQYEGLGERQKEKASPLIIQGYNEEKLNWLNKVSRAKNENDSDLEWLHRMRGYFQFKRDYAKVSELQQLIKHYEGVNR